MVIGTGAAEAARIDNQAKKDGVQEPSVSDIIDAGVAAYEEEIGKVECPQSRHEQKQGVDITANAARAYGKDISPQIKDVVLVEEPIVALIDDGIELAGTPDVITIEKDVGRVRDLKTGQPWTEQKVQASRQLTGYGILHRAKFHAWPSELCIDSIDLRSGQLPETASGYPIRTNRVVEDYNDFIEIAKMAVRNIKAGAALPAAERAWWCSSNWCPKWKKCPVMTGRRKRLEWVGAKT
jgi:hypothetical protein